MNGRTGESWRPVVGWEGLYEVSDWGRVRSLSRRVASRHGTRRTPATLLYGSVKSNGYRRVVLSRGPAGASHFYVHRLVAIAWCGDPLPGQEVCHADGDRLNNAATNLRWDLHGPNMRDAVAAGTHMQTRKSVCPRGHRLEVPNLRVRRLERGSRICISCDRATKRNLPPGWSVADMANHIYSGLEFADDVA